MSVLTFHDVSLTCGHEVTNVPDTWAVGTEVMCFRGHEDSHEVGRVRIVRDRPSVAEVRTRTIDTEDGDARYRVDGYGGIAFYVYRVPDVWVPYTYLEVDEDGDEYLVTSDDGDWLPDTDGTRVLVVMVGDDTEHEVDVSDLYPITDDDYCAGCGQIGCRAYG